MLPPSALLKFKISALPFVVAACLFLQGLNSTIIATSLPVMAADLGTNAVTLGAALTIFNASVLLVIPCGAWLGDRFGVKRVMVISMLGFLATSALCALSPNLEWFLLGRMGQGLTSALLAPLGRVIVLQNTPRTKLVRAMATIAWPALTAPVVGPIIGAYVVTHWDWHWIFWLNIPLGLLALGMIVFIIPRSRHLEKRPFDWLGYGLVSTCLMLVFVAIEALSYGLSWMVVTATLIVGLGAGYWARGHLTSSRDPLFDLRVLRIKTFRITTLQSGTILRIMISVPPFALPLILQVGHSMTAITAGSLMMVYFMANLAAKSFTTLLFNTFGFRPVLVWSAIAAVVTTLGLGLAPLDQDWWLYPLLVAAGGSRSVLLTGLNTLAVADISQSQKSSAMTLSSIFQQFAMAASISVATMFIHFSQMLTGHDMAQLFDFRWAFIGSALLGVWGMVNLFRLAPDAGQILLARPKN